MQPSPPYSAPSCWWQLQVLGVAIRHVICGFKLFIYLFFLPVMLPSEIPRFPTEPPVRVFPSVLKLLSFLRLPSWDRSQSLPLLPLFYLLYFLLPPFKDNGLPFWVPDVLCQHSEIVLWNLLSVQMFFQWICGGEHGLLVLFLCHLRTASLHFFFIYFCSDPYNLFPFTISGFLWLLLLFFYQLI